MVATAQEDIGKAASPAEANAIRDEALKQLELIRAKAAAESALESAGGDNPSQAVEDLIDAADNDIADAENTEDVLTLRDKALAAIALQKAKEQDAADVAAAIAPEASDDIKNIASTAQNTIAACESPEAIAQAKIAAMSQIALQKRKEDAAAAIEGFAQKYDGNSLAAEIIAEVTKAVGSAETEADVQNAIDKAIDQLNLLDRKSFYQTLVQDAAGKNPSPEVQALATAAVDDIGNAETEADMEALKDNAIAAIVFQQTKENATASLDRFTTAYAGNDEALSFIAAAREAVAGSDTTAAINDAMAAVTGQLALIDSRNTAISAIDTATGDNPSTAVSAIADQATQDISAASTSDEVDDIESKALADIALQQAKEAAAAAISNVAGGDPSIDIQGIVSQADGELAAATSPEEVATIKEAALTAIALQQAKEGAQADVATTLGEKPTTQAESIAAQAYADIDTATSREEIDSIKAKALAAVTEANRIINLWWVIALLSALSAGILVGIFLKIKSDHDANKSKVTAASVAFLPALATIIPFHAITIIIVLSVIAVILAIVLALLFLKPRFAKKVEALKPSDQKPGYWYGLATGEKKTVIANQDSAPATEKDTNKTVATAIAKEPPVAKASSFKRLDYSLYARRALAPKEAQERFGKLTNYIMAYEGVRLSDSWHRESFEYRGKKVIALKLRGKTMRVYFALDPRRFATGKYHVADVGAKNTYANTPTLLMVRGSCSLAYAQQLTDLLFGELKAAKGSVPDVDYVISGETRASLLKKGLIKE